jgi:hypothetical protein
METEISQTKNITNNSINNTKYWAGRGGVYL